MAFPPLVNSDHVVSVSIDFSINPKWDTPFPSMVSDHSRDDWDGICDHLRNVPWEDIFKACVRYFLSNFYFFNK